MIHNYFMKMQSIFRTPKIFNFRVCFVAFYANFIYFGIEKIIIINWKI